MKNRLVILFCLAFSTAAIVSCSKHRSSNNSNSSSGGGKITVRANWLFNTVYGGTGGLTGYAVGADGSIAVNPQGTVVSGVNSTYFVATPDGKYLYVPDESYPGSIHGYSVNARTGALTILSGSPFAMPAGASTQQLVMHPSGNFLFTQGSDTAFSFVINASTGQLTLANSVGGLTGTFQVAIDPLGKFLYVTSYGNSHIWAFNIDQTSGVLTAGVGSPFLAHTSGTHGAAIDPSGKYLVLSTLSDLSLEVFAIDRVTGALIQAQSPLTGQQSLFLKFSPDGKFLYGAGAISGIRAFKFDSATGALTAVNGSPFSVGAGNFWTATPSPDGLYVYAPDSASSAIFAYSVDQVTGVLTAVAGSPFTGATSRGFAANTFTTTYEQ